MKKTGSVKQGTGRKKHNHFSKKIPSVQPCPLTTGQALAQLRALGPGLVRAQEGARRLYLRLPGLQFLGRAGAGRASGAVELGLVFMSAPDSGGFMTTY